MSTAKRNITQNKTSLPALAGDLARLQILLAKKQEYIAVLELELTNTRADLNTFTQKYNQHIGPLQRQVNNLRKILYDALEQQRKDKKESYSDYPFGNNEPETEEAEFPEDEGDPQQNQQQNASNENRANGKETPRDPKHEEEIRDLFRKLAKRFHPDLTPNLDEKIMREIIMAQVNAAYTAKDLERLIKLSETPDIANKKNRLTNAKQVAFIRSELKRLDMVIGELETTIRQIDSSPIMHLRMETRLARSDGKDLLTDLAAEMTIQINDLEEHLEVLGVDYAEVINQTGNGN